MTYRVRLPRMEHDHPQCPRCGYDQSGEISRWEVSCPLAGVCSECGLEIEWSTILSKAFAPPPDFYEANPTSMAFIRTMLRSRKPRAFWSWVRMTYPVNLRRACAAAIIGPLFCYLLSLLVITLCRTAAVTMAVNNWAPPSTMTGRPNLWPIVLQGISVSALPGTMFRPYSSSGIVIAPFAEWLLIHAIAYLFVPVSLLLLPATLRQARVLPRHVVRITAYGMIGIPIACMLPRVAFEALGAIGSLIRGYRGLFFAGLMNDLGQLVDAILKLFAQRLTLVSALILPLWTILWWWRAGDEYLHFRHARAVAIIMTFLCALVITVVLVVAFPDVAVHSLFTFDRI